MKISTFVFRFLVLGNEISTPILLGDPDLRFRILGSGS